MKASTLVIFFISLLLFSCKKKNIPNVINNSDIIGSYEWSWSLDSNLNVAESSTSIDNYGVLVEEEGFIYTYKNGLVVKKYLFDEYFSQWGKTGVRSYENIQTKEVSEELIFLFENNEIQVFNFPFPSLHSNYFYKIE